MVHNMFHLAGKCAYGKSVSRQSVQSVASPRDKHEIDPEGRGHFPQMEQGSVPSRKRLQPWKDVYSTKPSNRIIVTNTVLQCLQKKVYIIIIKALY